MTQLDLPRIAADLLVAHRPALAEAAGAPETKRPGALGES